MQRKVSCFHKFKTQYSCSRWFITMESFQFGLTWGLNDYWWSTFLEYEWDSNQVNLVLINQQIVFPRKQFAYIYYSIWSIIFLEIIIIKNMTNVYYSALFYSFGQSWCYRLSALSPWTLDLDLETVATISELQFPESELVGISWSRGL